MSSLLTARRNDRCEELLGRLEKRADSSSPQDTDQMSEELFRDAIHYLMTLQGAGLDDYPQHYPERYRRLEQFFFTPEEIMERRMGRSGARGRKSPV